jgi:hypothetical protein
MKPKATDKSQSERFKEAARELGCDPSEERFAETVRKLAAAGPQHRPSKAKPKAAKR